MRATRALILLTGLTVAVPIGLGLYVQSQAPTTSVPTMEQLAASGALPNFAQFASVTGASSASTIALLGAVEAAETADVGFQTSGDVAEVLVSEGDVIEAGAVLARLDSETAEATYRDALLALERAQINLDDLLSPPTDSEIEQAQMAITSAQAAASDSSGTATDLQITQAQMKVDQAQESYDNLVYQRTHNGYTEEGAAQMDAQVGSASFNLEIARLQLEELQNPDNSASQWSASVRIQQAQNDYDQLMAGASDAQVTAAQLQVRSAEEQVASAERALAKLELIAPVSGTVSALAIDVGDTVAPGVTAVSITDLSQLLLNAPLNELDLDQVREGMDATVTFDALPDVEIPATLQRIAWIGAENSGIVEYDVWLLLNPGEARVLPGMTGEATINVQ
jgi:multidrug resistance efflux pump